MAANSKGDLACKRVESKKERKGREERGKMSHTGALAKGKDCQSFYELNHNHFDFLWTCQRLPETDVEIMKIAIDRMLARISKFNIDFFQRNESNSIAKFVIFQIKIMGKLFWQTKL